MEFKILKQVIFFSAHLSRYLSQKMLNENAKIIYILKTQLIIYNAIF